MLAKGLSNQRGTVYSRPFGRSIRRLSNSESITTWMVSILWKILHSMINSQPTSESLMGEERDYSVVLGFMMPRKPGSQKLCALRPR